MKKQRGPKIKSAYPKGELEQVLFDKFFYGENYKISQELRSREPIKKSNRSKQEEINKDSDIESEVDLEMPIKWWITKES